MAYNIDIFNVKGEKVKSRELVEGIFCDENINEGLIREFVEMQLANSRVAIAHTKTRGEVNGSGRKLYRQKGTGRARVGDSGSPIRRHGGVCFGPRNNVNYHKDMPKKMRRKALFGALTLKVKSNAVVGLENFEFDTIKTKNAIQVLKSLNLSNEKVLVILPTLSDEYIRSFKNLPNVKYILVDYTNPYDLLTYKKVLVMEESLAKMEEIFLK
ncbi:MAG: 50S ribosomal protein L4 [Candidatus Absconditabacteria bacterium]